MSKKNNDGKNQTHGFGTVDWTQQDSTRPDPGARDLTNPDWVRKDREFKEGAGFKQTFS